jgi:hypothetical protein
MKISKKRIVLYQQDGMISGLSAEVVVLFRSTPLSLNCP